MDSFKMYDGGKANSRYQYPVILIFTMIFYVVPLNGEMCSTMVYVDDGEDLTALQEKAVEIFKSTCRKSRSTRDNALPCYGPFKSSNERYPQAGFFNTPIERLEFSVESTNVVFLDLKDSANNYFAIELGRTSGIYNYNIKRVTGTHDIDIITTTRFWVTFSNNKITVGRYEDEAPFMEAEFDITNINYIAFDSYDTPAAWQIYKPCINA